MTTLTLTAPEESAFAHIAHWMDERILSLYETRGAMLDTAANMNPVPAYITSGIAEVTDEINLLTGVTMGASLPADELAAELVAIAQ
jgi:hypothetical protein